MTTKTALGQIANGRYLIEAEIGRGGFSTVYKALDIKVNQLVALKCVYPPPGSFEKSREKMKRELAVIRKLHHPNIINVFDFFEDGNWLYLVMEYLPDGSLQDRIQKHGPLSSPETVKLCKELCAALALAHANGVIHRDIKPQNILFHASGAAVLADFGSAKIYGQNTLSMTGNITGTWEYMSPEMLKNEPIDSRADLYSLGLVLYLALTARKAFQSSMVEQGRFLMEGFNPKLANPKVESFIASIVQKCTAVNPSQRFLTAQFLLDYLQNPKVVSALFNNKDYCLVCGEENNLNSCVCLNCQLVNNENDSVFLFVESPTEMTLTEFKTKFFPNENVAVASLKDCLSGVRPFLKVNRSLAEDFQIQFADMGLLTKTHSSGLLSGILTSGQKLMLLVNLVAGVYIGNQFSAVLLWLTWLFIPVILIFSIRESRRPVFLPKQRFLRLPPEICEKILEKFDTLKSDSYKKNLINFMKVANEVWQGSSKPLQDTLTKTMILALDSIQELDRSHTFLKQKYLIFSEMSDDKTEDKREDLTSQEKTYSQLSYSLLKAESILLNLQWQIEKKDEHLLAKQIEDSLADLQVDYKIHIEVQKEIQELLAA